MRRLLALLMALWTATAQAAVSQNLLVTTQTPKFPKLQLLPADTTTQKTLYACGTNGSKIKAIWATSTDTTARDVQVTVLNSSTYILTTVTVAINAGNIAATPPVNLMTAGVFPGLAIDSDGNPYFNCVSGDTLQAGVLVTLTAAKVLNVMVNAEDY